MPLHRRTHPRRLLGCALALALAGCEPPAVIDYTGPVADWPEYGATKGGERYSPLNQITRENVGGLEIAWIYHTGHLRQRAPYLVFQTTPLVVDQTLYLCTPFDELIALDPETGHERWRFDPRISSDGSYVLNCRGLSSWVDPAAPPDAPCRRRLVLGTVDARLIEVDARSGQRCTQFGGKGEIDLRPGLGAVRPGEYGVTSPPVILGDHIITGALVLDDVDVDIAGGVIRAYDVRTGELRWAWDPVPPGSPPLPPSPERDAPRYRRGTSNAWTALSADPERDLVFVPTGNTSPDYYGGHRQGLDHFSSSVVALRGATGELVWHFQTVHHDIWDYDVPAQPVLFDFPGSEGSVPAVAVATKMGHVFFLHRETGKPLFEVVEKPVPQEGAAPGEYLAPTQPFPTRPPPLHPASLRPEDAFGFSPWDRGKCRERIAALRSEGIFTPPSLEGSVHYPGMVGGINWGSMSVDSQRRILVTNTLRVASEVRLIPRAEFDQMFRGGARPAPPWEPQLGTPYGLYRRPLLSPLGAPCNPPPWGTLVGIDLASGDVRWEEPLGTTRDLAPWPLWFRWGVPNLGGSIVTASGLVFIGATTDRFLRAFDIETGAELWKGRLPSAGHATPATYRLRPDGKQYVVIAAGGHQLLGSKAGDSIVAFALP
jgi:quinoprotein glucose dehydrogenase